VKHKAVLLSNCRTYCLLHSTFLLGLSFQPEDGGKLLHDAYWLIASSQANKRTWQFLDVPLTLVPSLYRLPELHVRCWKASAMYLGVLCGREANTATEASDWPRCEWRSSWPKWSMEKLCPSVFNHLKPNGYYKGCFEKSFTTLKAYINLFRGYVQCFELSSCSKTRRVLPGIVTVQCDFHW
jgi:hypothetical protein